MQSTKRRTPRSRTKTVGRGLLVGTSLLSLLITPTASLIAGIAAGTPVQAQASGDSEDGPQQPVHAYHIRVGTPVHVRVLRDISSATAQRGDRVKVEVLPDDDSGIPAGTVFYGRVVQATPATPKSAGSLDLQFALPGDYENAPSATPISDEDRTPTDDASAQLVGQSPHKKGNTTGILAGAGALLGFLRKGKLGDAAEGGIVGAVGGTAIDQSEKKSASDVNLSKGSDLTITLDRPMKLETIVVPDDY